MSIFIVKPAEMLKPKCARCKRPFTPKKAGQIYGLRCAKIVARDRALDGEYVGALSKDPTLP